MFKTILVPFDGSKHASKALCKAIELTRESAGELLILTVFRHHSMLEASLSMVRPAAPEPIDDTMRSYATEIAESARKVATEAGIEKVRAFVRADHPARAIVKFAEKHKADLIVLGSRGLGSGERFMLGSVSHKVSGLAECPVLLI